MSKYSCHTPARLHFTYPLSADTYVRDMMPGEIGEHIATHRHPLTNQELLELDIQGQYFFALAAMLYVVAKPMAGKESK